MAEISVVEEQRVVIKFLLKLGKKNSEIIESLQQVFGEVVLCKSSIYEWIKKFQGGLTSVKDVVRSGRPATSRNEENVALIRTKIYGDRRLTCRELSDDSGLSIGSVHTILSKDLGMRRVSAKFVPRLLSDDQKAGRVTVCREWQEMQASDPDFIDSLITGDESWVYGYDPETKTQSSQWKSPNSPRPKKARMSRSRIKTMLVTFFDSRGLVHREYLPEGASVTAIVYIEILRRLKDSVRRKRPERYRANSWRLHHDNAPAHRAQKTKEWLTKNGVVVVEHPPYSPDLAPNDFYLFPKTKSTLKGERFMDIADIQANTDRVLRGLKVEDFRYCMSKWQERWQRCIDCDGEYFEGDPHV